VRTVIVVGIGLVALVAFVSVAPMLGASTSRPGAASVFIAVWLVFSVVDWYVGVFRAGYGALEELRIHAVIFAVPTLAALAIIWRTHSS
jgi:hypothetical protein